MQKFLKEPLAVFISYFFSSNLEVLMKTEK
jgi:hypothetical protein